MKRYIPFSQVAMGDTCWLVDAATGQPTTKLVRIGNKVKGGEPTVAPLDNPTFGRITVNAAALEAGNVPTFGAFAPGQVVCLDPTECVMVDAPDEPQAALNRTAAERAAVPPVRYSYPARFMYLVQGRSLAEFATTKELIEANPHDPALLAWLRTATVDGNRFITGGGATPCATFWRVA